jgi:hypothetical protein
MLSQFLQVNAILIKGKDLRKVFIQCLNESR